MPRTAARSLNDNDPYLATRWRANWVRLRTLLLLRWIAIAGQIVTVCFAELVLRFDFPTSAVVLVIGWAVATNIAATLVLPANRRLSERELASTLAVDMIQLSALLALTGGLDNPFALLVLAQVAIGAAVLGRRSVLGLCALAVVLMTVVLFLHMPLVGVYGEELRQPEMFRAGFWAAIVVGIVFQAAFAQRITFEIATMADALSATQMALSREQKLTDLGGVVAAAAHELGTPLATMALVAGELADEATSDTVRADALLIREQAERCRVILGSMGHAAKPDGHLATAPLASVVEEAAEPHAGRGIDILYDVGPEGDGEMRQPVIVRRPELIHGLRNLIQNAVDFADRTVWIDVRWSLTEVTLHICDDGPGYAPDLLPLLGDPFLGARRGGGGARSGMGLGLFIAKTLLERTGADVAFASAHARAGALVTGAHVTLAWERGDLCRPRDPDGKNRPITG